MKDVFLIYFFVCFYSAVLGSSEDEYDDESMDEENQIDATYDSDNGHTDFDPKVSTSNCWMSLNAAEHFKILDDIDARYANVREQVQESLTESDFDNAMIDGFKRSRGVALRHHQKWMIPSGLNLGGNCMLRVTESLLFFHRMKLRNNTYFRVDFLHNDLSNMIVRIDLALNDLHLKGAYERSLNTDKDPSVLIYTPTFGQVEFLLKNVKYRIEGRYRLINNRLLIELVSSDLVAADILMTYINYQANSSAIRIKNKNLDSFMTRMKIDLDKWIKDYFNDYLIHADMVGIPNIKELAKYDKEKGTALEEFTDNSIHAIATRIRLQNADSISLPTFTFKTIYGLQIKLHDGVLNGLDSMHRRSVATGYRNADIRLVDCVVGFSNLKVVYKYLASIPTGVPQVAGTLMLTANELAAHLSLSMVSDPETVDLDIEFLDQMKPESLTVEGAANIMISNFKHLLEHQIVTTMSTTLIHGILMLKSLPSCVPFVRGQTMKDKEETEQNKFSDWHDSESEEMLRGKTEPRGSSTKYPKSLNKQSNRSFIKKNQTELKTYKGKSKKSYLQQKNKT